jgi:hypothetical protein
LWQTIWKAPNRKNDFNWSKQHGLCCIWLSMLLIWIS